MYWIYIIACSDTTLYTGITTDLKRRILEHNGILPGGAKYTHGRRPVELRYSLQCENRSEALKQELNIKKLSKKEKTQLIHRSSSVQ